MGEYLTITMTERIPVRIKKDEWHIVAEAKEFEEEGIAFWEIKVRHKTDHIGERFVVHGSYVNDHPEFPEEVRHGFLVNDIHDVPKAIRNVQTLIKASSKLAHNCTNKMPAQSI
jgi:hypothetical protein